MVDGKGAGGDSPDVPTIAELLTHYRDLTGASYDDMSDLVGGAITGARFHQLTTEPPNAFPRPATLQHLANLLHLPVTTVILSFATSLGLSVDTSPSALAMTLPPGTDNLTDTDRQAVLAVIRALVDARRPTRPHGEGPPDMDDPDIQGIRLDETSPNLRVVEQRNGPEGT